MGLTFLAPLFFAGLAALAVPVIVHLVHKERPEGIPFPSLMFLQQIPVKFQKRQRIRYWFLFLLRCLAIALLVIAFSRPFLSGLSVSATDLEGGREVVVLLDRSLSMSYEDRWSRGLDEARSVIDGVGPDDRVSFVVFDDQAEVLNQPSGDAVALRAALGRTSQGVGRTQYAAALKVAESIFDGSQLPRHEVVVISDFQRSGWNPNEVQRLPPGAELRTIDLSTTSPANVTIASINMRREPRGQREAFVTSARVVNTSADPVRNLPVALEMNGQQLSSQNITVEPNDVAVVHFESELVPDGLGRGVVRIGDDGLVGDNAFHFVVSPGSDVSVLVLQGTRPRVNQSLFLQRALSVGDTPSIAVTTKPLNTFQTQDLEDADVVVLNDVPFPSGRAGNLLVEFVQDGGGLLLGLGDQSGTAWPENAQTVSPGLPTRVIDRQVERGGAVTDVDFGHPVFDAFSAPRSGDMSAAQFYRYNGILLADSVSILARFDDGGVALVERRVGAGRVMLWTSTLDTYWNNLGIQPVFVPFIHEVIRYLSDYSESQAWFTVGSVADLAAYVDRVPGAGAFMQAREDGDEIILESPTGDRTRIARPEEWLVQLKEQGFHEFRVSADIPTGIVLAANIDPVESDLAPLNVDEFVRTLQGGTGEVAAGAGAGQLASVEDMEQRQGLWWYLLIAALLLLAAETVVSNRLSRVVR
jgi:hypothetical protein